MPPPPPPPRGSCDSATHAWSRRRGADKLLHATLCGPVAQLMWGPVWSPACVVASQLGRAFNTCTHGEWTQASAQQRTAAIPMVSREGGAPSFPLPSHVAWETISATRACRPHLLRAKVTACALGLRICQLQTPVSRRQTRNQAGVIDSHTTVQGQKLFLGAVA